MNAHTQPLKPLGTKRQAFNMDGSITIYCKDELLMGATQYRLLNQIVIDGSINAAARNLKMSYQHAWTLINRMNHLSPLPIVLRQKGGRDGGGCQLSSYGLRLLNTYAQKEIELMEFFRECNRQLNNCLFS
ncbi:MAG: LysR family transcriptional regulator [Marinilabiliaceae bacterium]|nr:LysR family transcriptional regulator [Marinilabiliaceae bacterium]